MTRLPLVSIIVCTWNGLAVLPECVDSLLAQTCGDFELIIVDNGSVDETGDYLAGLDDPRVRTLRLGENHGFAGGNNAAFHMAHGLYLALVNNDTAAEPDWLERLIAPLRARPDVGMAACRLVDYYDRSRLDAVGHLFYPDGLNRGRGRFQPNPGRYTELDAIFFPPGCGSVYRRQLIEAVGGFDERFFAYGDDTELGLRARWAGWQCVYVPDAVMYHKISGTSGWYSEFKAFHVERNRVWVALKCLPLRHLAVSPLYTGARFLYQAYGALTGRGASGRFARDASAGALFRVLARAYVAAVRGAPAMWRRRRRIRESSVLTAGQFGGLVRAHRISLRELTLQE